MRLALHRYRCSSFGAGIAIAIVVVVGSGGVRELNLATIGVLRIAAAAAVRASAAVVPAVAQPDAAADKNTEN